MYVCVCVSASMHSLCVYVFVYICMSYVGVLIMVSILKRPFFWHVHNTSAKLARTLSFCIFRGDAVIRNPCLPSGKRLHNELERSTIFHGKIHYFYGHFQ